MTKYFKTLGSQSIWLQLLFFGILTAGSLILFASLGQLLCMVLYGLDAYDAVLPYISDPSLLIDNHQSLPENMIAIMTISQIFSQLGLFIVPPILMILLLWTQQSPDYKTLIAPPRIFSSLLVIPLIFFMLPWITWLTEVNMNMPLPDVFIRSEEGAALIMNRFFDSPEIGRFLVNLFMIAIIPAIGEELFFRGILQQYLTRGFKNIHLAIIVTAFIFSFFHFQFQGFIPRMALGMLFGYLMVWSGSLWLPIFAHFINNGSAVVIEFLHKREIIPIGHQEFGSDPSSTIVLMSALVTILICFIIYRAKDSQKEQEQTNT